MNTGMFYFLKIPLRRFKKEKFYQKWSGALLEFNKAEDGFTTKFIALNHISFFLEDQKGLIFKQDFLLTALELHTDLILIVVL